MNKCLVALCLAFFPLLALAADPSGGSSLSLTPPQSDYSVAFLGNLFGVVDGVLHGTGSQIMGAMFSVFNSAVLALGGIIIMYTLIVGTMNTAHEGEMLGHKWSSIWIPVRSTAGLALLIPKASGYCLMQIFVMWVVVQGVGAADKVWDAALNYLNRGGVIIQVTMNSSISTAADSGKIAQGAANILASEVCMLGLQKTLEAKRAEYLTDANKSPSTGPCKPLAQGETCTDSNCITMAAFCNTPVPDLLSTVDAIAFQTQSGNPPPKPLSMPVPFSNDKATGPYSFLRGICGNIVWNPLDDAIKNSTGKGKEAIIPLSKPDTPGYQVSETQTSDMQLLSLTRATAVQQMYMNYQSVAQNMVTNDPQIIKPTVNPPPTPAWPQATNVFGVPYSGGSAVPCAAGIADCDLWQGGYDQANKTGVPIFNGAEFQNGIADYNGVMMPTLNLLTRNININKNDSRRDFFLDAKRHGWLSAGSYFFDLVGLNGSATNNANLTDKNSGLDQSTASGLREIAGVSSSTASPSTSVFSCGDSGKYNPLCVWLSGNNVSQVTTVAKPAMEAIDDLIGTKPTLFFAGGAAITGSAASTTFGFVNNSLSIRLPGQPPITNSSMYVSDLVPKMAPANGNYNFRFSEGACNGFKIMGTKICLGRMLLSIVYDVMNAITHTFVQIIAVWINNFIILLVSLPLAMMSEAFINGVELITKSPGANPIVALAQMGVYYINTPANLLVGMMVQGMTLDMLALAIPIPGVGQMLVYFHLFVMAMAMPLITSWMGVMLGIGFTTAFYVPFLPYMIFTFGVIAWLTAVIEAMAAAPIVALAITHPEGEGILGNKGETALMILMNVFLRPAMMIIGYIAAIALCYVSVWIINSGFGHVLDFIKGGNSMYVGWAGLFVTFFSVLIYTSMYVTVAQKAFNLIYILPDHVLRWIGGHPEQTGHEAAGWAQESQKHIDKGGEESAKGQGTVMEKLVGGAQKKFDAVKPGGTGIDMSKGG